jgi:arylsulfatase A-like enzyme
MLSKENKGLSIRGTYGDVVEEIDRSVGEILKTLAKLNIAKNTLVLFTSDNGPWGWANIDGGSSGLLKGNKGSVYEGGYRVPAVAWMPKSIPRVTSTALATTLDLFPTILSQVDKDFEFKSIDGFDITKTLFENTPVRTDVHYYRQDTLIALRHKEWKLFIKDPNPWDDGPKQKDMPLLYNIEHDPSEKYDLAKDNPEIVQKLNILCQDHINSTYKAPSKYEAILPAYQSAYDENNKK